MKEILDSETVSEQIFKHVIEELNINNKLCFFIYPTVHPSAFKLNCSYSSKFSVVYNVHEFYATPMSSSHYTPLSMSHRPLPRRRVKNVFPKHEIRVFPTLLPILYLNLTPLNGETDASILMNIKTLVSDTRKASSGLTLACNIAYRPQDSFKTFLCEEYCQFYTLPETSTIIPRPIYALSVSSVGLLNGVVNKRSKIISYGTK